MNERVKAVILAYENAAIKAVVNAIARLYHWAIARKHAIITYKAKLRTKVTGSLGIE